MSALATLQRDFAARLLAGSPPADGMAIYRASMDATHERVLAAAFPAVRRLVGNAFFAQAARDYLLAVPCGEGNLHQFGARFAAWLAREPAASHLPWLSDVARLEWACDEALHAQDAAPFDPLAVASPARIAEIVLHPSVRLVASAWPVHAIWEANQPECDGTPARSEGGETVVVWRDGEHQVRTRCVDAPEAAFVAALCDGAGFADALGAFTPQEVDAVRDCVARCARDGLFSAR
jgi:hypothetical protein